MERQKGPENVRPGRRILIVDDNVDAADSLAAILRLGGHEVNTAYFAADALDMAAQTPEIEVFILDIGLPEMNGYELAQKLRELPHTANALLIALTGYGQDADRQRAYNAGFDSHCTKPIEFDVLNQILVKSKGRR